MLAGMATTQRDGPLAVDEPGNIGGLCERALRDVVPIASSS